FAKTIHYNSERSKQAFVSINCAALPEALLESELFGIEKGVATGVAKRTGKFEQAEGGTIFLDEIGDMSPPLQAKLLRALESREATEQKALGASSTLDRLDKEYASKGLERTKRNLTKTARDLGVDFKTLKKKIDSHKAPA